MKDIKERYKGLSFAQAAEKIAKKYKNREINDIEMNSYNAEMQSLYNLQESKKAANEEGKMMYGGKTKYEDGSPTIPTLDLLSGVSSINPVEIDLPKVDAFSTPTDTIPTLDLRVEYDRPMPDLTGNIIEEPQKDKKSNFLESAYAPAILGQALSTALNASQLIGGYDKVAPEYNPYEQDVRRIMEDRKIDMTALQNQIVSGYQAADANIANTRSAAMANALRANALAGTQTQLERASMNEQQANIGLQGQLAQTLDSLGQQRSRANTIAEDLTARNKGVFQNELSKLGVSIADSAKFFSRMKMNERQTEMMAKVLNNKYADFGVDSQVLVKYVNGQASDDEIMKLKQLFGESLPDFAEFMKDGSK